MSAHDFMLSRFERVFWSQVNRSYSGGCWIWAGPVGGSGYAKVFIPKNLRHHFGGVKHGTANAHRVSFVLHGGTLEPGMHVHHTCHNTLCVCPDHLRQVTPQENLSIRWFDSLDAKPNARPHDPILAAILQEELDGANFYDMVNQRPLKREAPALERAS